MYRQIRMAVKPFWEHSSGLKSIMIPHIGHPANNGEDRCTAECNLQGQDIVDKPSNPDLYSWLANHPEGPTQWDSIIDRSEIEKHLLKYNQSSFRAALMSPCGSGVILDALTFSTISPAGKNILQGIIPEEWHGNNTLLKHFLSSFAAPPKV